MSAPAKSVFAAGAFNSQIGKRVPLINDVDATLLAATVLNDGSGAILHFETEELPAEIMELLSGHYSLYGLNVLDDGLVVEPFNVGGLRFGSIPDEPPPAEGPFR